MGASALWDFRFASIRELAQSQAGDPIAIPHYRQPKTDHQPGGCGGDSTHRIPRRRLGKRTRPDGGPATHPCSRGGHPCAGSRCDTAARDRVPPRGAGSGVSCGAARSYPGANCCPDTHADRSANKHSSAN